MDHFTSSHIFCSIQRDSESDLLLIWTFKQFSVLKRLKKRQHSGFGKQTLYTEDAATLYVVT